MDLLAVASMSEPLVDNDDGTKSRGNVPTNFIKLEENEKQHERHPGRRPQSRRQVLHFG